MPGEDRERTPPRHLSRTPVLDGFRGLAILLVMCRHTGLDWNAPGVDVSFALSGFLITTLLCQEFDRSGRVSFARFYERRARRLLPALVIVVALTGAIFALGYPRGKLPVTEQLGGTLFFGNDWISLFTTNWNLGWLAPTWSLGVEEQFYLLWPIALVVMLRRGVRPWLIVGSLVAVSALLIAAELPMIGQMAPKTLFFVPLARSAELLLASAGALVWRYRLLTVRRPVRDRTLAARAWRGSLVARFAFAIALTGGFVWLMRHHTEDPGYMLRTPGLWLASSAIAAALMITLIGLPRHPLSRLIGLWPLRYVGRISYGVFIYHMLCWELIAHYLPQLARPLHQGLTFAVAIALASVSWYTLESRILAGGRRAQPAAGQPVSRARPAGAETSVTARPPAVPASAPAAA